MYTEAEVSHDGNLVVSSDEENDDIKEPDLDVYDGSFVDDEDADVAPTQQVVDMRSVYLRSVVSPLHPRRPPTRNTQLPRHLVCSQMDYNSDDHYAESDDSFVVSNDCVEYDTQADGLLPDGDDTLMLPAARVTSCGTNKVRKRKRIVLADSSSDETVSMIISLKLNESFINFIILFVYDLNCSFNRLYKMFYLSAAPRRLGLDLMASREGWRV